MLLCSWLRFTVRCVNRVTVSELWLIVASLSLWLVNLADSSFVVISTFPRFTRCILCVSMPRHSMVTVKID